MKFELGNQRRKQAANFTLGKKDWKKILGYQGKVVLHAGEDFEGTPQQARVSAQKILTAMAGKWSLSVDEKNGTLTINNTPPSEIPE